MKKCKCVCHLAPGLSDVTGMQTDCGHCLPPTKSEECMCHCHEMTDLSHCKLCQKQDQPAGWERELFRLASLVGTDAMNPEENLLNYVNELLSSQKQNLIRDIKNWSKDKNVTKDGLRHYLNNLKGESI